MGFKMKHQVSGIGDPITDTNKNTSTTPPTEEKNYVTIRNTEFETRQVRKNSAAAKVAELYGGEMTALKPDGNKGKVNWRERYSKAKLRARSDKNHRKIQITSVVK